MPSQGRSLAEMLHRPRHERAGDAAGLASEHPSREPVPIPVCRPLLPGRERLLPYLEAIDTTRIYSNYGPLHDRLLARLAVHLEVAERHLALASSGTSALTALILAVTGGRDTRRSLCIMPSYTFVATAAAARNAGLTPFFADIDGDSWALDPAAVEVLPQMQEAALVITVAPYGRMPDVAAWQSFSVRTGVPVIIDAAACFDAIDAPVIAAGLVPAVLSLHATKTFSTAEGGLIVGPEEVIHRAGVALNFGFDNSRDSTMASLNGKISEYHAAVGLADLDQWQVKRRGFITVARQYHVHASQHRLGGRIIADAVAASPYAIFSAADGDEANAIRQELDRREIGHRLWYGLGLHRQLAFNGCRSSSLKETDQLAPRLIGLPMAADLDEGSVTRIVAAIATGVKTSWRD